MSAEDDGEGLLYYFYASFIYTDADGDVIAFNTVLEMKKVSIPEILETVRQSTDGADVTLLGLVPLTRDDMLEYQQYMNARAREKATRFKIKGRTC